ncbi:helix-turn-helix domain-containing protein [Streptomyces sp. NPDC048606]|uniref:PucR family transcriptional regulator n=1 Tax=Streptomyces sp. NPDC048606 TaxID=3154726 RepID=UPI003429AAF5
MVSEAARTLAVRCEGRANSLARKLSREVFESVPGYAELPPEIKDLEIAATVRHGVRLFLRGVAHPPADPDGYALFRERAARRAEEGVPLHLLLRTYALGVHGLWQVIREEARPDESGAVAELVDLLLRAQTDVVGVVTERYLAEREALAAERAADGTRLAHRLLDGGLGPEDVRHADVDLTGPLLVLALGAEPAAPTPPGGPVGHHRRLRGLRSALARIPGAATTALLAEEPEGGDLAGRAVVPGCAGVPTGLAAHLSEGYGAPLYVAAAHAPDPAGVPEAARTAAEIVRIARASGLPADRVHRLDGVLLEFHLSRPGPGSDSIAGLLDPVGHRPELLATLRSHLELRLDRRATAAALGVHPNTVDKRLARLTALTGLDLSSPRGTALALAAQLLRETRRPAHGARDGA